MVMTGGGGTVLDGAGTGVGGDDWGGLSENMTFDWKRNTFKVQRTEYSE